MRGTVFVSDDLVDVQVQHIGWRPSGVKEMATALFCTGFLQQSACML
ncbi:hypothetical protein [Loktanella sp. M215]|nr:hypothetical protein [Loktanella sp. M215]